MPPSTATGIVPKMPRNGFFGAARPTARHRLLHLGRKVSQFKNSRKDILSVEMAATWTGDVVVIGGGWSGMLVAKHCKEHGLKVRILEKHTFLGGVWKYQEDVPGGVMASTQTTSSWSFTEISDFPLTIQDGLNTDFPKHDLVQDYLERFAAHNGLLEIASLETSVEEVTKDEDDNFRTVTSDGSVYVSKRLCVSTGFLGNPRSKGFEVRGERGLADWLAASVLFYCSASHTLK
jgi:NADPH-dependent 2,4-dienoyl-CoA reductase/sulfur reductase-like enzyme